MVALCSFIMILCIVCFHVVHSYLLSLAEQTDLMPEIDLEMTRSAIAAE